MRIKEGSKKCKFTTPGRTWVLVLGRVHISYKVKMHYFFKSLHLYSLAQKRQTEGIILISKEGSTNISNFMTHRAGISCARLKYCRYGIKLNPINQYTSH